MITFPIAFFSSSGSTPPAEDLILNIYPYASGAYSLRKLDKNYTGSCIRVRRSNDNVQSDIGFDSNGDLDTTALLAFVGSNSAFVTFWYDQSGLGNNMQVEPTSAASEPRIVNSGTIDVVNGKPAIYFDGSDDKFMMYNFLGKSTQTFFGAGLINAQDGLFAYSSNPSTSYYLTLLQGSTGSADQNVGTLSNYYTSGNFTTKNRGALYNDVATGQASIQAISNLDLSTWNNYMFNGYPGFKFQGYMQEIVTYDSSVADSTDIPNFTAIQGAIGKQYKGWSDYSLFSTEFDGLTDYVDCGNDSSLNFDGSSAFSGSAWVYWSSGDSQIFGNQENSGGYAGWSLQIWGSKFRLVLESSLTSYIFRADTANFTTNTWKHVAFTYDGSKTVAGVKIYIDGSEVTSTTTGDLLGSNSITSTANMAIGARAAGAAYFNGKIDEVAIFDSELSASDVTTIYNSGVPNDITSLSPTAWWRMGDESGYQYLTNKMSYSKYSTHFDGVDDYVDLNNGASVNPSSTVSLSCWVNFDALSSYDGIFGKRMGTSITMPFLLSLDNTSKIRFRIAQSDNTNKEIYTNSAVSTNTWYHVVAVADGTNIKLYLDGTLQTDTDTYNGTLKQSTADNVYIGRNANDYLNGNVDDAIIFSSALSASDVTDIYNSGKPKDESSRSNVVGYWRMGDNNVFPKIPNEIAYSKKSLELDGIDDYVDLGDSDTFSFGDGSTDTPFSISAWIYRDGTTNDGIVCKDASSNREWAFYIYSGTLRMVLFDNSSGGYIGRRYGTTITNGEWHHVAATYDGGGAASDIKLYLNGTPVDNQDNSSGSYTAMENKGAEVRIGSKESDPLYFDGNIDDVLITSTELSSSDITDIYNNGMPKDESARANLLGYWKMGDGDYFPTATDSSGNGNDGTIYNELGADMIQLDTPNGWGTAQNETAAEMIQGDTPKGNHGVMENMEQAAIKQDAPT